MKEYLEIFRLALLRSSRDTLLPDIFEIFGIEHTMRFLDTFAGARITVPSKEVIARAVRDASIYYRTDVKKEKVSSEMLAREYNLSDGVIVRRILQEMRMLVESSNG